MPIQLNLDFDGDASRQSVDVTVRLAIVKAHLRQRTATNPLERAEAFLRRLGTPTIEPGSREATALERQDAGAEELEQDIDLSTVPTGWEWTAALNAVSVMTRARQAPCARIIEAGVIAQGVLDGLVERGGRSTFELQQLIVLGQIGYDEMLLGNLRLVLHWARFHSRGDMDLLQDLFQEGVFGLLRAIQGWDFRRGYSFSTYASWHIRQTISRGYQRQAYFIHVPIHVQEEWAAARRSQDGLSENAARALQLVSTVIPHHLLPDFVEHGVVEEADGRSADEYDYILTRNLVKDLISALPERQVDVLVRRNGLHGSAPETLDEIGIRYHLSRERIRQLEVTALATLRMKIISWACRNEPSAVWARVSDDHTSEMILHYVENRETRSLKSLGKVLHVSPTSAAILVSDLAEEISDLSV